MLKHKWGKRIASILGMMLVLMLLISTLSVTVFAAETAPVATATLNGNGGNFWITVLGIVSGVLFIACITLIYLLKTHKEAYMTKIEELQYRYKTLSKLQQETNNNLGLAEDEIKKHEDWQVSALVIDPKIQSKINNANYQKMAEQFVNDYLQVDITDRSTADTFVIIDRILRAYNAFEPEVRGKITADMSYWEKEYHSVTDAYTKEANAYLVQVMNECGATTKDLSRLREAVNYYQALPQVIKASVPPLLIGKIRGKVAAAELHLPVPKGEGGHIDVKSFLSSKDDSEGEED